MPVHLHGAFSMSFLLLTGRCYDAETSVILLLTSAFYCASSTCPPPPIQLWAGVLEACSAEELECSVTPQIVLAWLALLVVPSSVPVELSLLVPATPKAQVLAQHSALYW